MKDRLTVVAVLSLLGCAEPPPARAPRRIPPHLVEDLPGRYVAPESCTRSVDPPGWLVSDQGCHEVDPEPGEEAPECPGAQGSVWLLPDGGPRTRIVSGLSHPCGVAQTRDGTVWVADRGVVVARLPGGEELRLDVPGAALLNDVEPKGRSGVWVADSVTGNIWRVEVAGGSLSAEVAAVVDDAPNGLAVLADGGLAVTTLGDLEVPGKAGAVRLLSGGARTEIPAPPHAKLDGVVAAGRGALVSEILDTAPGVPEEDRQAARVYYVEAGAAPRLVFDGHRHGLRSAADIGVDAPTGDVCVPDLAGSHSSRDPVGAEARVVVVRGLARGLGGAR